MRTVGAPCPLRCRSSSLCTQPRRGPWGGACGHEEHSFLTAAPSALVCQFPVSCPPRPPGLSQASVPCLANSLGLRRWRSGDWLGRQKAGGLPLPRPGQTVCGCVWVCGHARVCAGAGEPPVLLVLRLLVLALTADVRLSERRCAAPGDGTSDFVIGNGQGGIVSFAFPKVL